MPNVGKVHFQSTWSSSDHRKNGTKLAVEDRRNVIFEKMEADSSIIKSFRKHAAELDFKHDKYERIVKLSRDITIESKRIIFLLHSADKEINKSVVLKEADTRLSSLHSNGFKKIAHELHGEDEHQFLPAYWAGLQEFVEATTYLHYLKNGTLQHWKDIQKHLTYSVEVSKVMEQDFKERDIHSELYTEVKLEIEDHEIKTLLPPVDYIMGVADLTGELMRKCITSLGTGDIETCHRTCAFVSEIYREFIRIGQVSPWLDRKTNVLRTSLSKMESACYALAVRGTEIPPHLLAENMTRKNQVDDFKYEDEGIFY